MPYTSREEIATAIRETADAVRVGALGAESVL
jgi:undecaprenyl pyrophosphate synthase